MRVVVISDGISDIAAVAAVEAIERGWLATTSDDLDLIPVSAGGTGFIQALQANLRGEVVLQSVSGPRGAPVPATVFITEAAGRKTAYIEAAEACGLHLLPADERDPRTTTTGGVADLLRAAIQTGASRIVVAVGGTATNDGGAGMLAGLGGGDFEKLNRGPTGLRDVTAKDLDLGAARAALAGIDVVVASASSAPLLGFSGASGRFAPEKGATRAVAQELERDLAHFAAVCAQTKGEPSGPISVGQPAAIDVEQLRALPGAGSGGGLGFGLGLLGARILPGAEVFADAVDITGRGRRADLVFVATGALDATTLGDGPIEIAVATARANALATVALAERVDAGNRELATAGISAAYELFDTISASNREAADRALIETLAHRVSRIARSWSR